MAPYFSAVVIPEGVEIISTQAFFDQKELVTVVLPSSLKVIESGAFSYNEKLTTIKLPENLMKIGPQAFSETGLTSIDNLAEINIPDGLSVAANIDTNYKDGKLCFRVDSKGSITFAEFFSGEKIKESLALQKKLQEHKTVLLEGFKLKPDARGDVYSSDWNW